MKQETKTCQSCKNQFTIEPDDFNFYERIKVPPPTWCPECRLQRRLVRRNERALYKRKCDLCNEEMIAMYQAGAPFPVYCRSCWYSDKWDPLQYGKEYDFSRPFFSQFQELQDVVPRVSLQVDRCIDCDYVNQAADDKNCYLVFSTTNTEDSVYSYRLINCRRTADSLIVWRSENCYEAVECADSADLSFCKNCNDSLGLRFCYDLRNSQNCFLSSNRRNASYLFRNEQLTRDEYLRRLQQIDTGSYRKLEQYKQEFQELIKKSLHKSINSKNAVGSTGQTFNNVKNCRDCFYAANDEDCRFCLFVNNAKDSRDINNGCCVMELEYEVSTTGVNGYNVKLSSDTWPDARDLIYCDSCRNGVSNLFGCISLRGKSYCVLNKQCTKEEYEKLTPRIIEHMSQIPYTDTKGRTYKFGEFFPPEIAPYAYNETPAQDFLPLVKEQALALGCRWAAEEEKKYQSTIKTDDLSDHIKDVQDSIVNEVISCAHDGKCQERCS